MKHHWRGKRRQRTREGRREKRSRGWKEKNRRSKKERKQLTGQRGDSGSLPQRYCHEDELQEGYHTN